MSCLLEMPRLSKVPKTYENKYGTRLCDKQTLDSALVAVTSPILLDTYYVISESKDKGQREKFKWDPMDEEWKDNCRDLWWYKKGHDPSIDEKLYRLRDKLLSFGGEATSLPILEEDIDDILEKGQFWFGSGARLLKGRDIRCHENSCRLYNLNKDKADIRICTGYALSDDGMWRQHTWLIRHNAHSNQIIETTKKRIGYFGFVMTPEQCDEFCENYWL